MGFEPPETGIPLTFGYLAKAMELDPDYADIHFNNATWGTWLEWNWEKGEKEFLKPLAINPNDVMSRIYYAHLLNIVQRNKEAFVQGRIAVELDPLNPLIQALYGAVFVHAGKFDSAMVYLNKALALDPQHFFAHGSIGMAAYHLGEYDLVFEAERHTSSLPAEFFDSVYTIYQEQGFERAYRKFLGRIESLGKVEPVRMANRYAKLNEYEKVLDLLELGFEIHDPNMPYIGSHGHGFIDSLRHHERYLALMEKMKLPLPEEN
jgi:tetratricopeptide (TPR) repeat protein